ncbi:MAG TPA: NAD-dependent epimerase/dehydratase family protein [Gemmatimonadales bacterium]|jgi:nucleoside-diphosphate-sugar epimerase|nr:NAD-dependent epimerase/dehydratase family protein [Gemmatimonadales bacterium]
MRAVVTGGGGFLGRRIVELLRARGDSVDVVCRRRYPDLEALGATVTQLDIRDPSAVRAAITPADVVFHVAAKSGPWAAREEIWSVNVDGTRSILEAVQRCGVRRLVYTSTPSVVGYASDVENGRQDLPYASPHESAYPASKAAAERLVLAANGGGMATVALRPHLLIGPGDRRMMPAIVRRAARRQLRIVGDGRNRVDLTYVDNAAWAHLDAADAMTGPDAPCAGKAYFITNGQPVLLWEWLGGVLRELGLPPMAHSLSFRTARVAATAAELLWRALFLGGEPPITRFLAGALARSHWYDLEPARRDLGYRVRVPMEEATRRTVQWLAGMTPERWADPPPVHLRPDRSHAR